MSKSLLLVIDFINDIAHPKGKIAGSAHFIKDHHVIENSNQAIAWARKNNILIAFVKVGFSHNYLECPSHSPLFNKVKELGALKLGEWSTEFHEDLAVKSDDIVIIKHRISALYATSLSALLTANEIDTVILSGVATNGAIQSTTRDAHDRNYKVIVLEDACADRSEELHNYSIQVLANYATITKVTELK
jgi:nicotinamidase-related amidase